MLCRVLSRFVSKTAPRNEIGANVESMTRDTQVDSPREGASRRAVTTGAAWLLPVVAVGAPAVAHAATPCSPSTNFQGLQVGTSPSKINFYDVNNNITNTATLTYSSNGQGGDSTPGNTGEVSQVTGPPSWNYIELQLVQSLNAGDWVEITLTFASPVTGLSFMIHDIDKSRSTNGNVHWVDEVIVSPGGFSYTPGTAIVGAGTSGSPFTSNTWGDLPIATGQGSVRVTYAGSVSSVTIRYRAGQNGSASSQHVGLGDLSYSVCLPPTVRAQNLQRSLSATETAQPLPPGFERSLTAPYRGELTFIAGVDSGPDGTTNPDEDGAASADENGSGQTEAESEGSAQADSGPISDQ